MRFLKRVRAKVGDLLLDAFIVMAAVLYTMIMLTIVPIRWLRQRIYDWRAPFRSVQGPFVLVLRSFENRMATTRRFERVIIGPDGNEIPVPVFLQTMPDLTVIGFLKQGAAKMNLKLVGVSNGSSLDGALTLVNTPQDRWFDAVCILAKYARAVLVLPDESPALVKEIAYMTRVHSLKLVVLMPPSGSSLTVARHIGRLYRVHGIDLSPAWATTRSVLAAAGVHVPTYDMRGSIVTWDATESAFLMKRPWSLDDFIRAINEVQVTTGGAHAARSDLRRAGIRLLAYEAPAGTELDPSWNRAPFHPWPHLQRLRDMVRRDELSK